MEQRQREQRKHSSRAARPARLHHSVLEQQNGSAILSGETGGFGLPGLGSKNPKPQTLTIVIVVTTITTTTTITINHYYYYYY